MRWRWCLIDLAPAGRGMQGFEGPRVRLGPRRQGFVQAMVVGILDDAGELIDGGQLAEERLAPEGVSSRRAASRIGSARSGSAWRNNHGPSRACRARRRSCRTGSVRDCWSSLGPLDRLLQLVVAAVEGDHGRFLAARADRSQLLERLAEHLGAWQPRSQQVREHAVVHLLVAGGLRADVDAATRRGSQLTSRSLPKVLVERVGAP